MVDDIAILWTGGWDSTCSVRDCVALLLVDAPRRCAEAYPRRSRRRFAP